VIGQLIAGSVHAKRGDELRNERLESMIRKSGNRFSEKIMLKQRARAWCRFHL